MTLVVLAGLALRALEAHGKSLWLDELHSLHVAAGADLAAVAARVRVDLHPPLYFALLHSVRGLGGEGLRWLSILAGLAVLLPLSGLLRAAGLSRRARLAAVGALCLAPYQVMYGSELRAYALLELCAATLAWAAFTARARPGARFAAFALATAAGLWTHYFTAVAVLAVGAARLVVRAPGLLRWRTLVLAGTLGVLGFLPWVIAVESWVFTDPGVMWRPESKDTESAHAADNAPQAFFDQDFRKGLLIVPRTFVPMIGRLGPASARVVGVCTGLFFALFGIGVGRLLVRILRRRGPPLARAAVGMLLASAAGYAIVLFLALYFWRYVPEQQFVVAAWCWPIALGLTVDAWSSARARSAYAGLALALCLALGLGHVLGAAREDVRGGVRLALAEAEREDALLTSVLWQPPWYPDALPFDVYAPDAGALPPEEIPAAEGADARAVVVLTRRTGPEGQRSIPAKWRTIRAGRELDRTSRLDEAITVWVFVPR